MPIQPTRVRWLLDDGDDAPLPGFGAVAALLAAVLASAWLVRRTP